MSTFGQRLRKLRQASGLSQGELAGSELSASYISLLESGKRSPSDEVVHLLSARLGCSRSELVDGQPSDRDQRIRLELAYAKLAIEHGESGDARARLTRLLAEDGLPLPVRDEASLLLGTALQRLGATHEAVLVLHPLLVRATAGQAHVSAIDVGLITCSCYLDAGDLNQAVRVGEEALAAASAQHLDETTEYFRLAATVMAALYGCGDAVHARAWVEPFLRRAEQTGQLGGQAALYWNSGIAAQLEGRLNEAQPLLEKALTRLSELDNLRDYARVRLTMAELLLNFPEPDVDRARQLLSACLPDLQDHGSRTDHSSWNRAMSTVLLHREDLSGAEGRAQQALDLVDESSAEAQVRARIALHDALRAQHRDGEAAELLALAAQGAGGAPFAIRGRAAALLWHELAERFVDIDDLPAAVDAYRRALDHASVRDHGAAARASVSRLRRTGQEIPTSGAGRPRATLTPDET